jgi:hypothetical protein
VPGSKATEIVGDFFESDDWGDLEPELEAPREASGDLIGDAVFGVDDQPRR